MPRLTPTLSPLLVTLAMLAVPAVLATGCGAVSGDDAGAVEGDVPLTPRAIAAVALDHVTMTPISMQADFVNNRMVPGTISTTLRFRELDPQSDGDPLSVDVSPRQDGDPCVSRSDEQCTVREIDQGTLVLQWELVVPEEDHGYAQVILLRPDEQVSARWSGDDITGDPRQQDLEVTVETLEEIVQDQRLSLTTSQEVVDAGAKVKGWSQ